MILQAGVLPEKKKKKELYQGIWVYFFSSDHIDIAFIKIFIGKL